jgi:hypothetical protein
LKWELADFIVIGRILGNWEVFGFSNFHRGNLLDKKDWRLDEFWAIGKSKFV